jgi:hypothetical protein
MPPSLNCVSDCFKGIENEVKVELPDIENKLVAVIESKIIPLIESAIDNYFKKKGIDVHSLPSSPKSDSVSADDIKLHSSQQ